jgi:L,D-transpeptidase catalytic domain
MARFDRSDSVLNSDRVLHSLSYGAYALFTGVGQRWYAARDLFHQTRHSIHGSDHPGLGTAVSHGCVRLTLPHAATLYQLVGSVGMAKTKVVVSGRDPPGYRRATMPPRQPVGPFGGLFRF